MSDLRRVVDAPIPDDDDLVTLRAQYRELDKRSIDRLESHGFL